MKSRGIDAAVKMMLFRVESHGAGSFFEGLVTLKGYRMVRHPGGDLHYYQSNQHGRTNTSAINLKNPVVRKFHVAAGYLNRQTGINKMNLSEITSYIHDHIPLTSHLGAVVESFDGEMVSISAPLNPNLNHRNTAFGGSISALGILSGWTLLFLKLQESGIKNRLVIQKSSFDFQDPVDDDFKATCALPDTETWEKFIKTLTRHGRARITVQSRIESSSGTGGNHEGVYVAIVLKENESV